MNQHRLEEFYNLKKTMLDMYTTTNILEDFKEYIFNYLNSSYANTGAITDIKLDKQNLNLTIITMKDKISDINGFSNVLKAHYVTFISESFAKPEYTNFITRHNYFRSENNKVSQMQKFERTAEYLQNCITVLIMPDASSNTITYRIVFQN
jgi:hypothetical protein